MPSDRLGIRSARFALLWVGLWLVAAAARASDAAYDREPINYSSTPPQDCIAQLQARMDSGAAALEHDEKFGYLRAVLECLNVPTSSQGLVFSKTSFQRKKISPANPRAVYFGDEVYVGFVPGGEVLEITAIDPQQGAIFYSLSQQRAEKPVFQRQTDACLACHVSRSTHDVPGHVVRSVFPDPKGEPHFSAGTYTTTHESPLDKRWGGWYVTGTHGGQRHMGNVCFENKAQALSEGALTGGNTVDLSKKFDTSRYLSPHSDIAALMVLEHQTHAHNVLAWANYEARSALWYNQMLNESFATPAETLSESTERRLNAAAERVVECLLLAKEAHLTAPLAGTASFAAEFSRGGPTDARGRSLRQLDLSQRLLKHPCSYLIYSPAFDRLPGPVQDRVYQRLYDVLSGKRTTPEYAALVAADRQAVLEILRETKPGLPAAWRN